MKKFILALALAASLGLSFPELAAADHQFQLWTELKFSKKIDGSPFTFQWATENRFRNDGGFEYFLFNTTVGFEAQFWKWFRPGLLFRLEKGDAKDTETRVMPQFEVVNSLGPIEIADRNRFEFRFFWGDPGDDWRFRYRNRLKLGHKFKSKPVSYNPYVSDEIFIETGSGNRGFNQNRAAIGNVFGFCEDHIKFDLYYMLRTDKSSSSGDWSHAHVLGTSLGFKY